MTNPLAVRVKTGGNNDLVRFRQGLSLEILATVAGTPSLALGNPQLPRATQLGNRLFWLTSDNAYQKTGAGAVTEKLTALSGTDANAGWLKYYMHPVNGPGLFGCTHEASGELIKYDYLTDAWSKTNLGVNTGTSSFGQRSLITVNNIGYFTNGNNVYVIDPVAETAVSHNMGEACVICQYNDIVYVLRAGAPAAPYELGQLLGGVFVKLTDVTNSETFITSSSHDITTPLIYQIGGDTYVFCNNDSTSGIGGDGWVGGKWDGTTYTDLTNTLLPAPLRPGGSLAGNNDTRRYASAWKVNDNGTIRTFIHFMTQYNATASLLYEHVGATWVLRNSSQWGNQFSAITNLEAGGELYYDENELNSIRIAEETAVDNGMELEYYVNGDEGTADTFCALFYSKDGGGTWLRATITAPPGGTGGSSSIVSNNLQDVDADGDGGTPTTYTIRHDWTTDGLGSTDSVWWNLRCSKTAF